MTIQVHSTPNPNARKFVLPQHVFERSLNFSSTEDALQVPLARDLFALGGVYNVLLAQDFVTINKVSTLEWANLEPRVVAVLQRWLGAEAMQFNAQIQRDEE